MLHHFPSTLLPGLSFTPSFSTCCLQWCRGTGNAGYNQFIRWCLCFFSPTCACPASACFHSHRRQSFKTSPTGVLPTFHFCPLWTAPVWAFSTSCSVSETDHSSVGSPWGHRSLPENLLLHGLLSRAPQGLLGVHASVSFSPHAAVSFRICPPKAAQRLPWAADGKAVPL